jgi:hypothetical protein
MILGSQSFLLSKNLNPQPADNQHGLLRGFMRICAPIRKLDLLCKRCEHDSSKSLDPSNE